MSATAIVSSIAWTQSFETKKQDPTIEIQISEIAIAFVRAVTLPVSSQSRRVGPTTRWLRSQHSIFALLFLKHQRARMKKMVVGSTGKKMPSVPNPTNANPEAANAPRERRDLAGLQRSPATTMSDLIVSPPPPPPLDQPDDAFPELMKSVRSSNPDVM